MNDKAYLGDGVYVERELGMIRLSVSDGIVDTHWVFLEPEVWRALERWMEQARPFDSPKETKDNERTACR